MWRRRIISVSSSPPWRVGLVASFNVTSRLDSSGPDRLRADGHVVRRPQTDADDDDEWRLALTPKLFIQRCMFCGSDHSPSCHGNQRFSQIVSFDDAQGKSKSCSLFTSSPLCNRLPPPRPASVIHHQIYHFSFSCSPDELVLYFNAIFKKESRVSQFRNAHLLSR